MDGRVQYIHITVIPILTGECWKVLPKVDVGKRSCRKNASVVRLCADDVLLREKLVTYHDNYVK